MNSGDNRNGKRAPNNNNNNFFNSSSKACHRLIGLRVNLNGNRIMSTNRQQ